MRAKVLRSFVSREPKMIASAGQIIELPEDVDWVRAGLVQELEDEKPPVIDLDESELPEEVKKYTKNLKKLVENASLGPAEKAVVREKGKGQSQAVAPTKKPATKSPAKQADKTSQKAGKK